MDNFCRKMLSSCKLCWRGAHYLSRRLSMSIDGRPFEKTRDTRSPICTSRPRALASVNEDKAVGGRREGDMRFILGNGPAGH